MGQCEFVKFYLSLDTIAKYTPIFIHLSSFFLLLTLLMLCFSSTTLLMLMWVYQAVSGLPFLLVSSFSEMHIYWPKTKRNAYLTQKSPHFSFSCLLSPFFCHWKPLNVLTSWFVAEFFILFQYFFPEIINFWNSNEWISKTNFSEVSFFRFYDFQKLI